MKKLRYNLIKMLGKKVSYRGAKINPSEGILMGIVLSVNDEVIFSLDTIILPIRYLSELIIGDKPIDNLEKFQLYVQTHIKENGPVGKVPHSY